MDFQTTQPGNGGPYPSPTSSGTAGEYDLGEEHMCMEPKKEWPKTIVSPIPLLPPQ